MKAQLQGAAAGGGAGIVGMVMQSLDNTYQQAQDRVVEAAMQESYLELIQKMAEACGGG